MPTFQVSLIPSCFRSRRGAAPGCSPYPHQMVKRLNQRHKPTEREVTALPCPLHTHGTRVETQMATLLNPLRWQAVGRGQSRDTHLEDSNCQTKTRMSPALIFSGLWT